jgi:hypothetical protein
MDAQQAQRKEGHCPVESEHHVQSKRRLNPSQSRGDHELESENGESNNGAVNTDLDNPSMIGFRCNNGEHRERCQNEQGVSCA